ncbi:hypothetical protein DQ244_15200 [Blastococcus sp. TBT05-19]|nr:hypothetical protein DQ244_15200 [Blastococcus sp. TBT05-19]
MNRGRSGRSLGDRAASSGIPVDRAPDPAPAADDEGRHCWVRDPPETPGTWPGLLVEWRRGDDGWQGRVVYTVPRARGPVLVEAWLPAARLEPR